MGGSEGVPPNGRHDAPPGIDDEALARAQLYALVHDGAPGDVEFYRRVCDGGARVLELGSGTGRVSLALAEAGHEVVGLEGDAAMIAEAERQRAAAPAAIRDRVRFVYGDMTSFDLEARFDRVIVPFTGLYCLLDEAALDRCLARVAAHLTPEGVFAFDAYSADAFHAESRPEDYPADTLELVAEIEHRGVPLRVFERSTWDRDRQRVDATYVYRRADGSIRAELEVGHRYVLRPQIAPALARAGLSLLGLYGSFEGEPVEEESGSIIVLAELASSDAEP